MSKNSLCRKYRPFQIDDVVGQKFLVATLKQASISNKFAQSYIFSGTKGSGKTSAARIVANMLTCTDIKDGILCGKCAACTKIPSGFSYDVVELDGAAQRGVDEIEKLIAGARYSPSEFTKKVYILDEAHQLSNTAISAMLKIVEEPPDYLTFIFCTTEIDKIPDTILSRSQRFHFSKITSKDVANRLRFIATQEKIDVTDDALISLARLGRGSMRDSIGCLEQIATLVDGKSITDKHVMKYFGVADKLAIMNMVQAMLKQDFSLLLDQVNDLIMASANIKDVLYEISDVFRGIMILKAQNGNVKLLDLSDSELGKLKELATSFKLSTNDALCRAFGNVNRELEYNINDRWVLETTLIRCASLLKT